MKYKILISCLLLTLPKVSWGQTTLTLEEAEQLFLKNNLELREQETERLVAESAIQQAKLFNNPELSLEQLNLWSTQSQREGEDTAIPPFIGSFGKNTQFAIALEQEVRLGGKRRKETRVAQLNHHLLSLKQANNREELLLHFRSLIFEKHYYDQYQQLLNEELNLLQQISDAYQKQKELGFVSPSQLLRIQAATYEVEQERLENQYSGSQLNELIHSLMGISLAHQLTVSLPSHSFELSSELEQKLNTLFNTQTNKNGASGLGLNQTPLRSSLANEAALDFSHHPLILINQQEIELKKRSLALERSERIPNLTFSGSYDRRGGVWPNFIGFGIRFQLPVFNRNQGNIKAARALLQFEQSKITTHQLTLQNRVRTAWQTYVKLLDFRKELTQNLTYSNFEQMQQNYVKNLLQKNISVLEFLDFTTAYKEGQKIRLETEKEIQIHYFTLHYILGNKTIHYEK